MFLGAYLIKAPMLPKTMEHHRVQHRWHRNQAEEPQW